MTRPWICAAPLAAALAGCAGMPAAAPGPEVFVTHLFVVLDEPTYEAIRASDRIASLAATQEDHVETGTLRWTGFYIEGRRTYIELFGAAHPPPGGKEGDTGLALTVESAGGVRTLADRWRGRFGDRIIEPSRTATLDDGRSVPWFTAVELDPEKVPVAMETWAMEVDPGYLAARHPGSARIDDPLSRERYQSWKYRPERPFEDVVGLRAALAPPEMADLEASLRLAGWQVVHRPDGFAARGPDFALDVIPAGRRAGILDITLRLSQPMPAQVVQIGQAQLHLDGLTGRFAFWPREQGDDPRR